MKPELDYAQAVENAKKLIEEERSAGWTLAQITADVLDAGIPAETWAKDVGFTAHHARNLARTWKKFADKRNDPRGFYQWFTLANTTKERAEELLEVSEREGISVNTARDLVPPSHTRRRNLLQDLVVIRRKLLVSVEAARIAAQHVEDLSPHQGVAQEIGDAAGKLCDALGSSGPRRLRSVRGAG